MLQLTIPCTYALTVVQDKVERIILDGVVDVDNYYASTLVALLYSYNLTISLFSSLDK
jgi:hypothetical protein